MHGIALTFLLAIGLAAPAEGRFLGHSDWVRIEPGTHALLRLDTSVSTRTAKVGDPVHLRTASPIITDGLSIPIGSYARGVVTRAQRPGRVHGRGELEIKIVSITRPDGTVLPVTARSSSLEPPRRRVPSPGMSPFPQPTLSVLAGMAAGYGAAGPVSHWSHSEETVAGSGLAAGLATVVLVEVLKRGEDLVLRPGMTIDVVFENAAPLD